MKYHSLLPRENIGMQRMQELFFKGNFEFPFSKCSHKIIICIKIKVTKKDIVFVVCTLLPNAVWKL